MNRRTLLKALAACSGGFVVEGCVAKRVHSSLHSIPVSQLHLPKVLVSPDREIRTTVCLRPFRAPGFRLETERLGDKLCVHNYGHGGAGITLSWGTAQLAAERVRDSAQKKIAVLGCGVVGLTTARLLQHTGKEVTIYAMSLPPDTTSNSAGGLWMPYSVFDPDRDTPQFQQQLQQAVKFSYTYFQQFAGDDYSVHWMPSYVLSDQPLGEIGEGPFSDTRPESRDVPPSEHRFPYRYVRQFQAMLIEPHAYMRALLRDFRLAGGTVALREFHDAAELATLPEPVVVNCTGLGAKTLFSDQELLPIKGQLTLLLPQPEVNYIVLAGDLYMFPRRDGIVLGGTHVRGDWSLEPDVVAKSQILAGQGRLFAGL